MGTIGSLYVVGLPIGNPDDITIHALRILADVDIVAAEDTRVFKNLARHHNLAVSQVISHHAHNEDESSLGLLKVALVSDAGTPLLSDPGVTLVKKCYAENIAVKSIPGPSALAAALSVAPNEVPAPFMFCGFLPSKAKERLRIMQTMSEIDVPLIFYESPHRLSAHLEAAKDVFLGRSVSIFRELTKPYEEILTGSISDVLTHFQNKKPKGEFVIIYGRPEKSNYSMEQIETIAKDRLKKGDSARSIAKDLARCSDLSNSELYSLIEDWKTR